MLVTSYDPLRAYTYENGLVRFAADEYVAPDASDPDCDLKKCAHITNYSVQKKNTNYVANADADEDSTGHKWSMSALMRELAAMGHDVDALRKRMSAFETSMGQLLRCAFEHIEAVQTADMAELM